MFMYNIFTCLSINGQVGFFSNFWLLWMMLVLTLVYNFVFKSLLKEQSKNYFQTILKEQK
jgi:hypothetical protein